MDTQLLSSWACPRQGSVDNYRKPAVPEPSRHHALGYLHLLGSQDQPCWTDNTSARAQKGQGTCQGHTAKGQVPTPSGAQCGSEQTRESSWACFLIHLMKTLRFLFTFQNFFQRPKAVPQGPQQPSHHGDTKGEPGLRRSCPHLQDPSLLPQVPVAQEVCPWELNPQKIPASYPHLHCFKEQPSERPGDYGEGGVQVAEMVVISAMYRLATWASLHVL